MIEDFEHKLKNHEEELAHLRPLEIMVIQLNE